MWNYMSRFCKWMFTPLFFKSWRIAVVVTCNLNTIIMAGKRKTTPNFWVANKKKTPRSVWWSVSHCCGYHSLTRLSAYLHYCMGSQTSRPLSGQRNYLSDVGVRHLFESVKNLLYARSEQEKCGKHQLPNLLIRCTFWIYKLQGTADTQSRSEGTSPKGKGLETLADIVATTEDTKNIHRCNGYAETMATFEEVKIFLNVWHQ